MSTTVSDHWDRITYAIFYLLVTCAHAVWWISRLASLLWGVTNKQTMWLTGLYLQKKKKTKTIKEYRYVISLAEWWIWYISSGEKNNIFLSPCVLKGVSSHCDAKKCLTKFRTDVSRWADARLEYFFFPCMLRNNKCVSERLHPVLAAAHFQGIFQQ